MLFILEFLSDALICTLESLGSIRKTSKYLNIGLVVQIATKNSFLIIWLLIVFANSAPHLEVIIFSSARFLVSSYLTGWKFFRAFYAHLYHPNIPRDCLAIFDISLVLPLLFF